MTRNLPAADWTSKFVEANGIRHHYLEWGDASKPALLMLHATGLCAWSWKPVARELAQDYRVLAFDQRGHGDTDRSDRGYRFEFVGDDLAAIVEKLDLERPRVIGHLSGRLAAILAANLIPDRLGPVVLVETRVSNDAATVPTQDLNLCAERTRMKRAVWESREAMFAAYRTRAAFKDWESEALEQFTSYGTTLLADGRAELKCHPETGATFYSIRDSLSVQDYFAGLNGDWLLLLADYPGCQRLEDAGVQQFRRLVAGATVAPMGKGSHFLPMEFPGDTLAAVRAWFDEISQRA